MPSKLTFDTLQLRSSQNGGTCLTTEWSGVGAKYEFRCKDGHTWTSRAQNVLHKDRWCPTCGKQFYVEHDLKTFQTMALNKGGVCLSDSYEGIRSKLTFMCAVGHVWSALPGNLLHRGSWCYFCARESTLPATKNSNIVVSQMDRLCESKGGKLISRQYRGCDVPMIFECAHKHQWFSLVGKVKKGYWCKECEIAG
jgi:hypothetical protein